jgi:glutathione-independent formaldehyde dehydrogenase
MASNRGVVYAGPGKVEVRSIDYPKMVNPAGKKITASTSPKPSTRR